MAKKPMERTATAIEETTTTTTTLLSEWIKLIDRHLENGEFGEALVPIRLILGKMPRHLPTYERLLHAAWHLQLWDEGLSWAARLLQADAGNALAWRSLAIGFEQRGNRPRARQIWMRAFEASPYDPAVRAGLSRTTLHNREPLTLNQASLATLYLANQQWYRAEREITALLSHGAERTVDSPVLQSQVQDLKVSLMIAQWQQGRQQQAYRLARQLLLQKRNLVFPWYILNDLGDINDKALAHSPLQMMDPDGEYLYNRFGIQTSPKFVEIEVTYAEVELLGMIG